MIRNSWYSIGKTALSILGAGALVVTAATVPNAVQALAPLVAKRRGKTNTRALERSLHTLQRQRLVEFVPYKGNTAIQITEDGKKKLREFEFEKMTLSVPKHWDKQWTVILFDIPEERKSARDALRRKLRDLQCYPLHRSVFVHPADCRDEIDFVVQTFELHKYIIHFRVPSLGYGEGRARIHFKLLT